jgi:hypothetical protein
VDCREAGLGTFVDRIKAGEFDGTKEEAAAWATSPLQLLLALPRRLATGFGPTPKTNTCPVVMYPEGVVVGKVTSGKNAAGRVRHVAKDTQGRRVGTYDTFAQARDALVELARGGQS